MLYRLNFITGHGISFSTWCHLMSSLKTSWLTWSTLMSRSSDSMFINLSLTSGTAWTSEMNNTVPTYDCRHYIKTRLPCKHFLSVFCHSADVSFASLPSHLSLSSTIRGWWWMHVTAVHCRQWSTHYSIYISWCPDCTCRGGERWWCGHVAIKWTSGTWMSGAGSQHCQLHIWCAVCRCSLEGEECTSWNGWNVGLIVSNIRWPAATCRGDFSKPWPGGHNVTWRWQHFATKSSETATEKSAAAAVWGKWSAHKQPAAGHPTAKWAKTEKHVRFVEGDASKKITEFFVGDTMKPEQSTVERYESSSLKLLSVPDFVHRATTANVTKCCARSSFIPCCRVMPIFILF